MNTTHTNETKWKQAGLAIYADDQCYNGRNHGGQFIAQLTSEECREADICGEGFKSVALFDYDTQYANARLMTAAPELLYALELALVTIERLRPSSRGFDSTRRTKDIVCAAIAKAKGGV